MTKYGYARVSTASQNLSTQVEMLKRSGVEEAFIEAEQVSGTKAQRAGLQRIINELQAGDELHVVKLDRLGRNMRELQNIASALEAKQVSLVINGQMHDPATPTGRLLFSVLAMVAEFERDMIAERTADRLAQIKAEGGRVGRKKVTNPEQEAVIHKMLEGGYSYSDIRTATGLSNGTISRLATAHRDSVALVQDPTLARQARKLTADREKELSKFSNLYKKHGEQS